VRGEANAAFATLTITNAGSVKQYQTSLLPGDDYTGVIEVAGLEPRTDYSLQVEFRPGQESPPLYMDHGRVRTAPPIDSSGEILFLFGSCNLHSTGFYMNPDKPFRRIGQLASEQNADFILYCGDQIYYDIPNIWKHPRLEQYRAKYRDAWGDCKPAKKLLTRMPHYMILDDHEMVDNFHNDMDARNNLSSPEEIRQHSLKAYEEYQHSHNPQSYGASRFYYSFSWGPCEFFVLDARTERVANTGNPYLLGEEQLQHFLDWLTSHRESVKFVVCSVPFVTEVTVSDDKWSGAPYRKQREHVMQFLLSNNIDNVIFLTGDMHHSYRASLEITDREQNRKITVHELMSSPLNNRVRNDFDWQYNNGVEFVSADGRMAYITRVLQSDIYTGSPNITLVRATGSSVKYEVYRTRHSLRSLLSGAGPVRIGSIKF